MFAGRWGAGGIDCGFQFPSIADILIFSSIHIYIYIHSKCIKALTASALGYMYLFFLNFLGIGIVLLTVVLTQTSGKITRKLRPRALYNRLRNATALEFI